MTRSARRSEITLHGPEGFAAMREAGRVAAELLDHLTPHIVPGITTAAIDDLVVAWTQERKVPNGPFGYRGFPRSVCTSVNHVVCHGIPGDKKLDDGDIINIDVTPIVNGWYGDTSRMYYVGNPGVKARKLVEVTYECLMRGIEAAKPGATLGDIGHAIQTYAEDNRFSVVKDFCGHGVGQVFHCEPSVLHYGSPGTGLELKPGMIFTIEPMINSGKADTKVLADGWTAVTKDRSLSAQFEHTIGITEDGCEIFTLSPKGWHCPPYA
ncbi:type I methionyl aminopeptidase [Novispirillum itersonii]|uniref:Methionine aminopeptidase n=1 Tax=Novispirillum itersonii TaxID=189 RepID=A0A7W9ZGP5_NOVIT|nr:type I methionyl aminopeptidase [Novispirillum itersonii]MBB6209954.1 methionyl aminopeptidase [Novispirillum itersonii]